MNGRRSDFGQNATNRGTLVHWGYRQIVWSYPYVLALALPIGKRGDDQSTVVPEVLVAVKLHGVDHLACDRSWFSRESRATTFLPVVAELRQPIKLPDVRDLCGFRSYMS